MELRPIETAKKDVNKRILGYRHGWAEDTLVIAWSEIDNLWVSVSDWRTFEATHWAELPVLKFDMKD